MSAAAADRPAVAAAYAYGVVVAACMGWFLVGIPIQYSDSFGNIAQLDQSWGRLVIGQFYSRAYLRPFLWAELKLVYDLSGGNYFAWYRGVQVLQVLGLILLYLTLIRPVRWRDLLVVPLGLAALIGIHTFQGTVDEAFPINTFLTILLCCFAAANLSLLAPRWWTDVLAVLLFIVAALTVESGLLVWVVFAAAALAGARGVSRRGLAAVTALFAGYFVLRFAVLHVGSPALLERSSGFGFQSLDPPELIARFGGNPLPFYAYNVMSSVLSVLFAEPRSGVFQLTRGVVTGQPSIAGLLTTVGMTVSTLVIAAYAWRHRREWVAGPFDRGRCIVAICAAVLAANAVISYPYTKDVVMSPAGAFYAAALFIAVRELVAERLFDRSTLRTAAAAAVAIVLAGCWAIRDVGIHLHLRGASYKVRNEWAYIDDQLRARTLSGREAGLLRRLQSDAIDAHPAPPYLSIVTPPIFEEN